ncbi:MAG: translation initiation factor IF-2, partial [Nitrospinota bacterium]
TAKKATATKKKAAKKKSTAKKATATKKTATKKTTVSKEVATAKEVTTVKEAPPSLESEREDKPVADKKVSRVEESATKVGVKQETTKKQVEDITLSEAELQWQKRRKILEGQRIQEAIQRKIEESANKKQLEKVKDLRKDRQAKYATIAEEVKIKKQVESKILQKQEEEENRKKAEIARNAKLAKEREEREIQRLIDEEERLKLAQSANKISIGEKIVVRDFAELLNVGVHEIIQKLIMQGIMANLNQTIDGKVAKAVAIDLGFEIIEKVSKEEDVAAEQLPDISSGNLEPRPPVITIMGHVDHGKTSLLDLIRKSNLTDAEAGGITQRIGAYTVELDSGSLTFIDTPGHEAFTTMRSRGAAVTDIVIIVVAADDGVMPQTKEAIDHANAANVPIVVAINKIDKEGSNPDKVKQELASYGLAPEEWGGSTIYCEVSATRGDGINNLLEMILLQAEVLELKADPGRRAIGTIIESKMDINRGPVATILVQNGTLNIQDPFVAGGFAGKVRALVDDKGRRVKSVKPSFSVEVLGFSGVPPAGEQFLVIATDKEAVAIAQQKQREDRLEGLQGQYSHIKLENLHVQMSQGEIQTLNIIIKADLQGSIEAVNQAFNQIKRDDISINILHVGVGGITDTDVLLAEASNAIIIGFNVRPTEQARIQSEQSNVDIRLYNIIYDAINDIKKALSGMLKPLYKENILGRATVRETFHIRKLGSIAGSIVVSGKIIRGANCRLIRDDVVIYNGKVESLKRFKDDAKEVLNGYECGIGLENFNDIKANDIFEIFEMVEIERQSL